MAIKIILSCYFIEEKVNVGDGQCKGEESIFEQHYLVILTKTLEVLETDKWDTLSEPQRQELSVNTRSSTISALTFMSAGPKPCLDFPFKA